MGDATKNAGPSRRWPLWLFVVVCLLVDVAMMPFVEWLDLSGFDDQIFALMFVAGTLMGQCCFVAVVAGLTQRSWVGAFLLAISLAALGVVAVFCGTRMVNESNPESLAVIALVPLLVLAGASPLYALRRWFGWRLSYSNADPLPRQPHSLADIFAQIAIVSAALVMARVPQVVMENDVAGHWVPLTITCLIMFGVSLVVLPLHVRIAFGSYGRLTKIAWFTLLPLIILTICFGIIQCLSWNQSWRQRLELVPYEFALLGTAIVVFYCSLWVLLASGMALVRVVEVRTASSDPASNSVTNDAPSNLRRLTWWRIGGAIAVTTATSIGLANLERWRSIRDAENAELEAWAEAIGGHVGVSDRIPTSLILSPRATDEYLRKFRVCSKLEYLELRKSNITDAGLAELQYYPNLTSLILKSVNITDEGLVHLQHLSKLETLQITDCQITGSNLAVLPAVDSLVSIDFSRTQFGDDQSELLVNFPKLYYVALNNTRVTARSLTPLAKLPELVTLELRGTDIAADRVPTMPMLNTINLDETNANDAVIEALANSESLWDISVSGTEITNRAVEALSSLPLLYRLDLSETRVDDDAVASLAPATSLMSLDLAGTDVTGSGFAKWPARSSSFDLILDRCPVDDDGIKHLIAITEFDNLSLAKTSITDASLQHLVQVGIENLDLCETQITFNGMITNGLPSVSSIHVQHGQFTPQEIKQIEKQLGVDVKVANDDGE